MKYQLTKLPRNISFPLKKVAVSYTGRQLFSFELQGVKVGHPG